MLNLNNPMTKLKSNSSSIENVLKVLIKKIDGIKADSNFDLKDIRVTLDLLETKVSMETRELKRDMEEYDKKNEVRYDTAMTHLVDIAAKFQKFDEEGVIVSGRVRKHEDRIEKLEKVVFKSS